MWLRPGATSVGTRGMYSSRFFRWNVCESESGGSRASRFRIVRRHPEPTSSLPGVAQSHAYRRVAAVPH